MVVDSPAAALRLLSLARDHMGEGVSAFELMHRAGPRFSGRDPAGHPPALGRSRPNGSCWSTSALPAAWIPAGALETLFAEGREAGLVSDGMIAQSEGAAQEFWELREQIPEANRLIGAICSHDISLPLGRGGGFHRPAPRAYGALGQFRINCFGHLGDGNLHYNVFPVPGQGPRRPSRPREAIHRLRA